VKEEIDDRPDDPRMRHAGAIGAVCQEVHRHALKTLCTECIGAFLGGDHSMAIGTVSAALRRHGELGLLWVDAHGDCNTPDGSPSGNVHGMVVAALMGLCPPELTIGEARLRPEQIVYIGVRDLDAGERDLMRETGMRVFTMRDLDEQGMARVARSALEYLAGATTLHVSWDMDSLDPHVVAGVGTPVSGGLTYREAHLLAEMLADDGRVRSFDLVEINPILDRENHTARVAVELAASLLGQRIL
jgi:arginase